MFKKRIKISAFLFSILLMVLLSVAVVNNEISVYQGKEEQANEIAQNSKEEWQIYTGFANICYLREKSPISAKKFISKIIGNIDFQRHDVMYFPELKEYGIWNYMDTLGQDPAQEFRHATTVEATVYYKNLMTLLADIYPGFSLWYYFAKLLILFAVSSIPSLLVFLSSLFAVSFPITVPITAIVLVFFTMVQGYADDTVITKLMTSSTGEENNLTLGMLYLADKTGALIILPQKGIWGAYGPVWKFSKGMAFFPVGVICGKGENGFRVEHLSIWSISSVNVGKFNHVLMGSYNHPLVKDRSPFASFKETLYYTAHKLQPGIRVDYLFQKAKEWKKKISIGPTLKLAKKNFGFHIHASLTKPYTIKTEWELVF